MELVSFVSLVGAGLGAADLITLRGMRALEAADVVLYDALANPELLQHCPQAKRIYVGKKGYGEQTSQEDIHALMIQEALAKGGQRVVRLKGGDSYVFGRGGEEVLALTEAGISYEVIPGLSSAIAAAACAGIPVTHRGVARHFTVTTGHDLATLPSGAGDTLVILMGTHQLAAIAKEVLKSRPPKTPAAVVMRASYPDQQVWRGTLGELGSLQDVISPAVIVIGDVVSVIEQPEKKPPLVVIRTREAPSRLADMLRVGGAEVVELPLLSFSPLYSREAIGALRGHRGWVVFSSEYAVDALWHTLEREGLDTRVLAECKVAAIGTGTAAQWRRYGLRVDWVPSRSGARYLAAELPESSEPVLHFGSEEDEVLRRGLEARGQIYVFVKTYHTEPRELTSEQRQALEVATGVVISSGVGAKALARHGTHFPLVTMGEQTSVAAREAGFTRISQSETATLEGLSRLALSFSGNT